MDERKFVGMQQDSGGFVFCQLCQPLCLSLTIGGVTRYGEAEMLEVNANLVRAARMQDGLDQRGFAQSLNHVVACVSGTTFVLVAHGHSLAVRGVTRDGGADVSFRTRQCTA